MNDEYNRYIQGLRNLRVHLDDNSDQQLSKDVELLQMRLAREIAEERKFGGEPRNREINKILGEIIDFCRNNTGKAFVEWCDGVYNAHFPSAFAPSKTEPQPDRVSLAQPDELDPQNAQSHDRLKALCEQFAQCQQQAEQAEQHLTRQGDFTSAQGKRAIHFLSDLSDPIRILSDLLKPIPLPSIIAPLHHDISLTLHKINKEILNLNICTDQENKQTQIIYHICAIKEQIKETIHLLGEALATAALPSQEDSQLQAELTTTSILFLPLPEARTGNIDSDSM